MSTAIVTDQVYPIDQGGNVVILSDRTSITIQAKYRDGSNWATLVNAGSNPSYTLPYLANAEFKVTAQSGGNEARFEVVPYQG